REIEQHLVDIEEDHLGPCHRSVPPLTQDYNARCSEVASRCSAHVLAACFGHAPSTKIGANKGNDLNCCGKMPSLRTAGLPGSFNLPKQLQMSPSPTKVSGNLRLLERAVHPLPRLPF